MVCMRVYMTKEEETAIDKLSLKNTGHIIEM